MALPSTLHHFDVALANVDRGVQLDLAVKAARHPSETAERLWLRLLAYCWQWEERIAAAELAALDEPLLRTLAAVEDRRIKVGLTLADDHLYVELGGQSFDGPLVRGRP